MASIIGSLDAEAVSDKLLPPISRGLEAIFLTNGSLAKARKNFALGKPNGQIVGTPTVGAGYLRMTGNSHFVQTQVQETDYGTYFSIARAISDMSSLSQRPMVFSTFQSQAATESGLTIGVSLLLNGETNPVGYAGRGTSTGDDTSASVQLTNSDTTAWTLHSLTIEAGRTVLRDHTRTLEAARISELPRFRSNGLYRIGSAYLDYNGVCDISLWQAHSVVLNDTERNTTVEFLRKLSARYGIIV